MNNQISERIIIARKFKSIYNWKGKSPEKKENTLKRVAVLDYWIVMVLLFFLFVASAMSTFQIESLSPEWTNAGLLVVMAMSLSFRSPFSYIELMLHKHINQIKDLEIEFDEKLNIEFDNIISRFNKRKKNIYLIGIPSILILIPALFQVFEANPYWDKFPPLVLVISLYLIVIINYKLLVLKKNLAKVVEAI